MSSAHTPRAGQSLRRHAHPRFKTLHDLEATWIKCTNAKHEVVYINLDNAVTVTRNDVADRIADRGTVISFMGGEQVYIVVNEQPEDVIKPNLADRNSN